MWSVSATASENLRPIGFRHPRLNRRLEIKNEKEEWQQSEMLGKICIEGVS